jgi:hypothetical protein
MRFLRIASCLALGLTLVSCESRPPVAPDVVAGRPEFLISAGPTGDRYGNVALMLIRGDASSPWQPWCSGTLVAPAIVLTAGHCVFVPQALLGLTQFGVTFDAQFSPAAHVIAVTQSHLDPDFYFPGTPFATPDNPIDMHDLALLVLENAVDRVPAHLPPAGLLDHLSRSSVKLAIVGFGMTTTSTDNRGTRNVGAVQLAKVFGAVFETLPDPTALCGGDSGGPVFLGSESGKRGERGVTTILGLTHWGDCATYNMHYRVDTPQARAFLSQYLALPGKAAAGHSTDDPLER